MPTLLYRLYTTIARSKYATLLATKINHVSNLIIQIHLADTFIKLGEDLVVAHVAGRIRNFIDVGANVGRWSEYIISLTGDTPSGLLFEPSTSAFAILSSKFKAHPSIEVVPKAVGDLVCDVVFYEESNAGEMSSLLSSHSHESATKRTVKQTTIDTEVTARGWDRVDFLKIDAEGFDFFVLKGASKSLSRSLIHFIQFEYNAPWREAGATLAAARRLLEAHDYSMFLIRSDGLYELDYERYGEYYGYSNFLAVAPGHRSAIAPLLRGRY